MDAWVTVRYKIKNVCDEDDYSKDYPFEDLVEDLIETEGILGLCDGNGEILEIRHARGKHE